MGRASSPLPLTSPAPGPSGAAIRCVRGAAQRVQGVEAVVDDGVVLPGLQVAAAPVATSPGRVLFHVAEAAVVARRVSSGLPLPEPPSSCINRRVSIRTTEFG